MAVTRPKLESGGYLSYAEQQWGPLYGAILSILDPALGTILPLLDPAHGKVDAGSFNTVGAQAVTFSWSEAPSAFDAPPDLRDFDDFHGVIPWLEFNGTNEEADSPDAAWPTHALEAFSVGAWVDFTGGDATSSSVFSKFDNSDDREWLFGTNATDKLRLELYDEDEASNSPIITVADAAVKSTGPTFVGASYDGSADATGLNLWEDGEVVASTDTDNGNFVSMRNYTAKIALGYYTAGIKTGYFEGKLAGGPCGPFHTTKELGAGAWRTLYNIGKRAMEL